LTLSHLKRKCAKCRKPHLVFRPTDWLCPEVAGERSQG